MEMEAIMFTRASLEPMKQKPSSTTPTIFIIFGATGDLMAKKIVPALFHLWQKKLLPKRCSFVAVGRRPFSAGSFEQHLTAILSHHKDTQKARTQGFFSMWSYHQGMFHNPETYHALDKVLKSIDDSWGTCSNKLFYLAVPPSLYENIFRNLSTSRIAQTCADPDEGWTRIIVEKPFGKDLKTAKKLDMLLGTLFHEKQIYRIDHYLAKEMLQTILTFRFSNNMFEQSWSGAFIERIAISFLETLDVADRGAFYDGIGAFRDIGQNHVLQMLALVTLDHPQSFSAENVRPQRAMILRLLERPTVRSVRQHGVRGQYKGYRLTPGVSQDSETETYFLYTTRLKAPRWKHTDIVFEGGKGMGATKKEIEILFRHPLPCLCPPDEHYKNKIVFSLEPEEKISIHIWNKKPGLTLAMHERIFTVRLRESSSKKQYVEEYEKLLLDCIAGDQTLFVSTDEVRAMWAFTDPLIKAWEENVVPLYRYKKGALPPISKTV